MESDSIDIYESDNLIWQLEITLNKLAGICKKNGKLVDYINKKVTKTVSEWNNEKDHFKKLSWAEMDDSDLDLDLDITLDIDLPSPLLQITQKGEQETPVESEGRIETIDHAAANPDPQQLSADIDMIAENNKSEGLIVKEVIALINTTMTVKDGQNTVICKTEKQEKDEGKCAEKGQNKKTNAQKKRRGMFVRWRQKLEETEKFETEKLEQIKKKQRLRMKRAEQRVEEHHKMVKSKNVALKWKLREIEISNKIEAENMVAAIKERQIKAEKKKEEISSNKKKQIEENLNKRHQNAANKRDRSRYHNYRRNSLCLSQSECHGHDHVAESIKPLFDENMMNRLSGKFLYIPRIVRKSSSSDLYGNIENLYRNTSHLLSSCTSKEEISSSLSGHLRIWIANTCSYSFSHSKYNKDVLLVMNRLICFDLNALSVCCGRLMISVLLNLSKNKQGTELLSLKYSLKLLLFARNALNEYFFAQNDCFEVMLPQIMALLVCIFSVESSSLMSQNNQNNSDYKKFKNSTLSSLLLNVIKSSFLIKIASVFHCIELEYKDEYHGIIGGMLNILNEITLILSKHYAVNAPICDLIHTELFESTQCVFIPDFIYRNRNIISNRNKMKIISKCLLFLNNLTKYNGVLMTCLWKENEKKLYAIVTVLCAAICNNNESHNMKAARNIFSFISYLSQDVFDDQLIHNLCNNIPFYFILQRNGQNVLFPALIAISLENEKNLRAIMASSLNIKHLKKYIQRNATKTKAKTPSAYWANCLRFYNV